MPYKDPKDKAKWMRGYMKEYMRKRRAVKTLPNVKTPSVKTQAVRPEPWQGELTKDRQVSERGFNG